MSPHSLDQQILKPRFLFLMSTSVGCPTAPSWIPLTKTAMIQLIYSSPLFALTPTPLPQPWNSLHCSVGCGSWVERKPFQVGSLSHTDTSGPWEAHTDPSNRFGRGSPSPAALFHSATKTSHQGRRRSTPLPALERGSLQTWGEGWAPTPASSGREEDGRASLKQIPLQIPYWCFSYPQREEDFQELWDWCSDVSSEKSPFWSFSQLILATAL